MLKNTTDTHQEVNDSFLQESKIQHENLTKLRKMIFKKNSLISGFVMLITSIVMAVGVLHLDSSYDNLKKDLNIFFSFENRHAFMPEKRGSLLGATDNDFIDLEMLSTTMPLENLKSKTRPEFVQEFADNSEWVFNIMFVVLILSFLITNRMDKLLRKHLTPFYIVTLDEEDKYEKKDDIKLVQNPTIGYFLVGAFLTLFFSIFSFNEETEKVLTHSTFLYPIVLFVLKLMVVFMFLLALLQIVVAYKSNADSISKTSIFELSISCAAKDEELKKMESEIVKNEESLIDLNNSLLKYDFDEEKQSIIRRVIYDVKKEIEKKDILKKEIAENQSELLNNDCSR